MKAEKQFGDNRIAFYIECVKILGKKNVSGNLLKRVREVSCASYVLNIYEYEMLLFIAGFRHTHRTVPSLAETQSSLAKNSCE